MMKWRLEVGGWRSGNSNAILAAKERRDYKRNANANHFTAENLARETRKLRRFRAEAQCSQRAKKKPCLLVLCASAWDNFLALTDSAQRMQNQAGRGAVLAPDHHRRELRFRRHSAGQSG